MGTRTDGSGAWLVCHGGCDFAVVLAALRLTPNDLRDPPPVTPAQHVAAHRLASAFPPPRAAVGGSPAAAGYRHETFHAYGDDVRKERLRRPTDGAKTLRWERRNPAGEWVPGLPDGVRESDLPLYQETDVVMGAAAGETVVLVESESSVDDLVGLYSTTWAGGATSPPLGTIRRVLSRADVVIVPDHDDAGLACLAQLRTVLPEARVVLGDTGEDARDLYRRIGRAAFEQLLRRPDSEPEDDDVLGTDDDLTEEIDLTSVSPTPDPQRRTPC